MKRKRGNSSPNKPLPLSLQSESNGGNQDAVLGQEFKSAGVAEWQTRWSQKPVRKRGGSSPPARTILARWHTLRNGADVWWSHLKRRTTTMASQLSWLEQQTVNLQVLGSSPRGASNQLDFIICVLSPKKTKIMQGLNIPFLVNISGYLESKCASQRCAAGTDLGSLFMWIWCNGSTEEIVTTGGRKLQLVRFY